MTTLTTLTTSTADIEKLNEHIVLIRYYSIDTTLEPMHIQENLDAAQTMVNPHTSGLLVVTGQRTLLSGKARQTIIEKQKDWKGIAVKINNTGQQLMGNFS